MYIFLSIKLEFVAISCGNGGNRYNQRLKWFYFFTFFPTQKWLGWQKR